MFGTNRKVIYDFLSRRQLGKYCALSLEFMNLLGIYTVGVVGPSADVYYYT